MYLGKEDVHSDQQSKIKEKNLPAQLLFVTSDSQFWGVIASAKSVRAERAVISR